MNDFDVLLAVLSSRITSSKIRIETEPGRINDAVKETSRITSSKIRIETKGCNTSLSEQAGLPELLPVK